MSLRKLPTMAVLLDSPDEGWRSMDLVGGEIVRELRTGRHPYQPSVIAFPLPRVTRRVSLALGARRTLNADRLLGRFLTYPARVSLMRSKADVFHLVDHSYAQLVHVLPHARTGVHLHDLDAFRCLLPMGERRPAWFRAMARVILSGVQNARVVFCNTLAVRTEAERHGLLPQERIVHAPPGVAPEYRVEPRPLEEAIEPVRQLSGVPYLLHVGSAAPRKRLDVLFSVTARLRELFPDLKLVQVGAELREADRARVQTLNLGSALIQPPLLDRTWLASLYAHSILTLVTSEYEGFGLPIIEALATGARVVASDIPVLREVGGDEVAYCPVGDVERWTTSCTALLNQPDTPVKAERRRLHGRSFSWERHVDILCETYRQLLG